MQIVGLVAMSHSPSWDLSMDHQGPGARYVAAVSQARELARAALPDAIVVFGPDHCRNFFFDLMPAFCIGAETLAGFGDYSSPAGPLPAATALARGLAESLMERGFDPALSLRMGVDHGITQAYGAVDPTLATPLVPVLVNCAGPPMPSLRRCHGFGQAVGRAIRAMPGAERVLVVGSGGLSHSPPSVSPDDPLLSADNRDYVINGRGRARDFNAAREQASIARRKLGGVGPINEAWDGWFLQRIATGDLEPILAMSSEELLAQAGVGGQEVRAWMAALGAWDAPVANLAYEPVPTWITGMGCISAFA